MVKKTGKEVAMEMAQLLDQGHDPLKVLQRYTKASNVPEEKLVENFHKHNGMTVMEWASKPKAEPQKVFEYGDAARTVATTLDTQPRLRRDKDLFIKSFNRKKLYELLNNLATVGLGYEPEVANDISNYLITQWMPSEEPKQPEPATNYTGAYTDQQVQNPQQDQVNVAQQDNIQTSVQPIEVCTDGARLTDKPKNLPELSKFFQLIAKHFIDMKQEIMDIYYGACDNLQAQGDWDSSAERYECQMAAEDVKILLGGLSQPIMEEIAFANRILPEKDTLEAAKMVFEWMNVQAKQIRGPLTEGFKITTDAETRYWKVRLDAIKEWETRLGTKAIEKAWKAFLKNK